MAVTAIQLLDQSRSRARSRATGVRVVAALAIIHVVDDRFLQPEPGTRAIDHLVSGLVPLAVLHLAAAVAPRLGSGVRAVVAAVVGLAAVTAGVEGGDAALNGGLSRDDWSGIAALVAGAGLLIITGVDLWRTRRRHGSVLRSSLRRVLLALAALIVALQVAYPLAIAYVGTHRAAPPPATADIGVAYQAIEIRADDGSVMQAWYVPSRNRAAVITYPSRRGAEPYARWLAQHGYGVLLLDRRGQGGSEGDPNSYGWGEHRDIAAAIAALQGRADVDPQRIGGIGFSVGGEVLLETAARTTDLRAVVAEGAGFRSVNEFHHIASGRWITSSLAWVGTLGTAIFSDQLPPPDLLGQVERIGPRPVLLIQAEVGVGGEELNPLYAARIGPSAELWQVPGSGHVGGMAAQPAEYERRVTDFFDRALLGGTA